MNFDLWIEVLKNPLPTFKKQKKKANLVDSTKQIAVAGIITGFLTGLYAMMFGTTLAGQYLPVSSGFVGAAAFLVSLIMTPIVSVVSWLILSAVFYVFALLLGGKGDYKTQSYLYAIYNAPLSIVIVVVGLIPLVGPFLSIIPAVYGLYLLTMSLKEAHGYSVGRALLTWLIPVIAILFVVALIGAIALLYVGQYAGSLTLPKV